MNKDIAVKLLALRKQSGFSQEELAEKLGVSRQAVSKWERAEASPDTENLISIAKIYKISLDRLFDLSPENDDRRSGISLKKDDSSRAEKIRVRYPEDHVGKEIYPQDKVKEKTSEYNETINDNAHYAENDDQYKYFNYETHDEKCTTKIKSRGISIIKQIQDDESYYKTLMKLPYPLFVTAIFLMTSAVFDQWHPMWMVFLTIPLYYTAISAIRHRDANVFCFPVFVALLFFMLGFVTDLWHPGWLIFVSIPIYYWGINSFKNSKNK